MLKRVNALMVLGVLLVAFTLTANAQIEYIIQYDDGASVYYSGRPLPGDTCGVWFEPPTESQILSGLFTFNNDMGGDALVYIWNLTDDFDPDNYYDSDESGASPGPTPLAEVLAGPIPYTFVGGSEEEIVFDDYGFSPEELDVGLNPFYLGYKLQGTGAEPYYPSILGDAADDRPYHSLTYLTDPGGSYPGDSGWWAYGIDWLIRCKVSMYGDPPPVVDGLMDLPDTYTMGPYTVSADITDQIVGGDPGVVDEARLIYSIDGGDEVTVMMTNTGGDTYEGALPAIGVNSMINYRIEADDDQNHTTIAPSVAGYNFSYRQPSGSTILLVNDSGDTEGDAFYMGALDDLGYSYDYWYINPGDAADQGYAGSDVFNTDNYRTILWFNGTGHSGYLPDNDADLSTDPIAMFMDDGGNFFLTSSDYLGGAFNPDVWDEFTAIPGTFMYEYLKVSDGWSDAHLDPGTGESLDTLFFGVEGTMIGNDFTGGIYDHPDPNYNDYAYPYDGDICFETEIDGESAGIEYDGAFKMVFLPWVLEAADDLDQAQAVLGAVLDFFGEGVGPAITIKEGSRYAVGYNAYTSPGCTPHPVRAEVTDPDGVSAVDLLYSYDGGSWITLIMDAMGGDMYQVYFGDHPADWSTFSYRVRATDNLGNVTVGMVYDCWSTDFEYNGTTQFLYCSDQPYKGAYHPNYDSTITDVLDEITEVSDYQVYDVSMYGTPDFWSILNKYDMVFWVGYGDWDLTFPIATADNPFTPYLGMGKCFLFSSEEQFGVWTDWTDTQFGAGNFAHDMLNVDWLYNDVGYTSLDFDDPPDALCAGLTEPVTLDVLAFDPYEDQLTPADGAWPMIFFGDGEGAGMRNPDDSQNYTITLGFALYAMEQASREQFINNIIGDWLTFEGSQIGVEPGEELQPITYKLNQNFPNPFNPATEIQFSIAKNSNVELSVYNVMGQEVARLLDRPMNAGYHTVTFDASDLSSGVYFYKLKAGDFEKSMKMILVK